MAEAYDIEKYSRKLKKYIDENRYFHTQGVRFTAASLAMAHGIDYRTAFSTTAQNASPTRKSSGSARRTGLP